MPLLSLQLKENRLNIADELPGVGCDLSGLQKLVGGTLTADAVSPDVVLCPAADAKILCRFAETPGCYSYEVAKSCVDKHKIPLWRNLLLLACAAQILRGKKIMPVHGCLLLNGNGKGALLCGQSGMGKTTTANRWKAAGGKVAADDMILLEYGGETLYAHPMPTWSRCMKSTEGESVPFAKAIPLETVLALSRGEKTESIDEVEGFKYMAAVYSACSLFHLNLVKNAAAGQQERLSAAIKACAELLYERFPHRMFFAHLECDIKQTFAFFLQEDS